MRRVKLLEKKRHSVYRVGQQVMTKQVQSASQVVSKKKKTIWTWINLSSCMMEIDAKMLVNKCKMMFVKLLKRCIQNFPRNIICGDISEYKMLMRVFDDVVLAQNEQMFAVKVRVLNPVTYP